MSDHDDRLAALLSDLEHGRITAAQACARVRGMTWPRAHGKTAFQARLADALNSEGDPPPDGSFADVVTAYHAGRLTAAQYEQLHEAYADAKP